VMLGGAAVSYPMGGYACTKARKLARASGIDKDGSTDYFSGSEAARERIRMTEEAVAAFNRRRGAAPVEPTPAVVEEAAPETPAPASGLRDAIAADGRFTTFVRLFDTLGLARDIEDSSDFTVFAPTDAAFAKVPASLLEDKKRARKLMLRHFSRYARTHAELADKRMLPTRGGTLDVEADGGTVTIEGATLPEDGFRAGISTVYAIDRVLVP
jgi:uncharacterized surface protein with fasciclin (FAS1) repeats